MRLLRRRKRENTCNYTKKAKWTLIPSMAQLQTKPKTHQRKPWPGGPTRGAGAPWCGRTRPGPAQAGSWRVGTLNAEQGGGAGD